MNFKHKLGYMFIGCLFTILGYILASLGGTIHAQKDEQVIDKIVCRALQVVYKDGKIAAHVDSFGMTFYNVEGKISAKIEGWLGGSMTIFNTAGKPAAGIAATKNGGTMGVVDAAGKLVVDIVATENGGAIKASNTAGKTVVGIGATENGGAIAVSNAAGKPVAGISADKDGNGTIQTYKGGWRTH